MNISAYKASFVALIIPDTENILQCYIFQQSRKATCWDPKHSDSVAQTFLWDCKTLTYISILEFECAKSTQKMAQYVKESQLVVII